MEGISPAPYKEAALDRQKPKIEPEAEPNFEKAFERRHAQAAAGVEFEQYLKNQRGRFNEFFGDAQAVVDDFLEFTGVGSVPPSFKKMLEIVVTRYQSVCETAEEIQRNIHQDISVNQGIDHESVTPEQFGQYLFFLKTHTESKNPVRAEQKFGYLILYCEEEDYLDFFNDDEVDQQAAGIHHESFSAPFLFGTSFIVMKKRKDDLSAVFLARVEAHEEQHFINNTILDAFKSHETASYLHPVPFLDKPSSNYSVFDTSDRANAEVGLKDEILAFLKDGSSGKEIKDFLCDDMLYQDFFDLLTDDEITLLKSQLKDIGRAFDEFADVLVSRSDLLVYHLIDIPFELLAQYIRQIGEWYRKESVSLSSQENDHPVQMDELIGINLSPEEEKRSEELCLDFLDTIRDQDQLFIDQLYFDLVAALWDKETLPETHPFFEFVKDSLEQLGAQQISVGANYTIGNEPGVVLHVSFRPPKLQKNKQCSIDYRLFASPTAAERVGSR